MNSDKTEQAGKWSQVYKKTDETVSRHIAGETIIVPIKGKLADMQKIFTMNAAAKYIWGLLDGRRNLDTILNEVLIHFDVQRQRAEADIGELIAELMEEDLISRVN